MLLVSLTFLQIIHTLVKRLATIITFLLVKKKKKVRDLIIKSVQCIMQYRQCKPIYYLHYMLKTES